LRRAAIADGHTDGPLGCDARRIGETMLNMAIAIPKVRVGVTRDESTKENLLPFKLRKFGTGIATVLNDFLLVFENAQKSRGAGWIFDE
jgi:hypothetical protein